MSLINFDTAVMKLKQGIPVALPTETVYGLACPITSESGLQKIFELKKRPLYDPLIVHVANLEMATTLLQTPHKNFSKLAHAFWPGPLTLLDFKNPNKVSDLITSGLDKVALRVPRSEVFQKLILKVGPLAAPSANLFKKISPTSAQHILDTFPEVDVLDGGISQVGIESTIFDLEQSKILRPGDITPKQIEVIIGSSVDYKEQFFTPGSEKDHYKPNTPVYIFEDNNKLDAFLKTHPNSFVIKLSSDPKMAAQSLYTNLRRNDNKYETVCIYFSPTWRTEEWDGVKNRLIKASSQWIKENE